MYPEIINFLFSFASLAFFNCIDDIAKVIIQTIGNDKTIAMMVKTERKMEPAVFGFF